MKYKPYNYTEKTTALDLEIKADPYHIPNLREIVLKGL
jgi:hypothetical protein